MGRQSKTKSLKNYENKQGILSIDRNNIDILYWSFNTLTTEKGDKLDFVNRRYLREIYDNWSKKIVIKKAGQMGLSNYAINRALWLASNYKANIIYTMPTGADVSSFSQTRVNPIILKSKINKNINIDNVKAKSIGDSFIFFKGTWEERQAISTPSDFNIYDEIDKSRPDVIEMFAERLSASPIKWELFISTPTISNFGIDAEFNKSDKREWFTPCLKCGKEQVITENHINYDANSYQCEHCKSPLDNRLGKWKATRKSDIAGYHITQLMASWIKPREILDKKNNYRYKRDYYNFVLGECYDGGDTLVNRLHFLSCIGRAEQRGRVSIGVDWGDTSYVVVRSKGNIIHYQKIEGDTRTHAKQVAEIIDKFDGSIAVTDFGYGDTKNKELFDLFNRPNNIRVWACIYTEDGKDAYPRYDEKKYFVNIDRTLSLQERLIEFKEKKVVINQCDDFEEFILHHLNLVEVKQETKAGVIKTKIERSGADHYAHANNYAAIHEMNKSNIVEPIIRYV